MVFSQSLYLLCISTFSFKYHLVSSDRLEGGYTEIIVIFTHNHICHFQKKSNKKHTPCPRTPAVTNPSFLSTTASTHFTAVRMLTPDNQYDFID